MYWLIVSVLLLLAGCAKAQDTPPPASPAPALSHLSWSYPHALPERFVIERRLQGVETWTEIAALPCPCPDLRYTDSSLAPTTTPQVVHYRIYAVSGAARSEATPRVTTTIPAVTPAPTNLACTVTQVTATAVTITCPLGTTR